MNYLCIYFINDYLHLLSMLLD